MSLIKDSASTFYC